MPMMDAARVRRFLDEAEALGARDYYFTGGEPMMHPEFWPLVDDALLRGPLTVLTNGILIDADAAARARARLRSRALLVRSARLARRHERRRERPGARQGHLRRGSSPASRSWRAPACRPRSPSSSIAPAWPPRPRAPRFLAFARSLGLPHPRVKFLPLLRIGREERRTHGYCDDDVATLAGLSDLPLAPEVVDAVVCSSSRLVTATACRPAPSCSTRPTPPRRHARRVAAADPPALGRVQDLRRRRALVSNLTASGATCRLRRRLQQLARARGHARRRRAPRLRAPSTASAISAASGRTPIASFRSCSERGVVVMQGNYDHLHRPRSRATAAAATPIRATTTTRSSRTTTRARAPRRRGGRGCARCRRPSARAGAARACSWPTARRGRVNEFLWESTSPDAVPRAHADAARVRRAPRAPTAASRGSAASPTVGSSSTSAPSAAPPTTAAATSGTRSCTSAPGGGVDAELVPVAYDWERLAAAMRSEQLPAEFVETIETGWWTTCLEILPPKERARGKY